MKIWEASNLVHDFPSAEAFLGEREHRALCNNTVLHRLDADAIAVRLHETDVVTYHRDGTFTLNTGGWHTLTTMSRINDFTPVGINVYRESFVPYIGQHDSLDVRWVGRVELVDGIRVDDLGRPVEETCLACGEPRPCPRDASHDAEVWASLLEVRG
jgi:hypothetical protein